VPLIFATIRDGEAVLHARDGMRIKNLAVKQWHDGQTCSFSSLLVFEALAFELLFESSGDPGAMQAGAETRRSQ
jgi:hypothetical protein